VSVLARYALDLVAALGGGGMVAFLLTLRQRRQLLDAQTADTHAAAFQRIINAAGDGLEHTTTIVPQLLERITRLEAREETREQQLDAMRTQLDLAENHSTAVDQWIDELRRWATDHRVWDQSAVEQIQQLGGHIDAPPPIPDRRHTVDLDLMPVPAGATT
jgi:hypothetical protein